MNESRTRFPLMAFDDPDLLPFVESQTGSRLTTTVVAGIRAMVDEFGPEEWVIKAVFRLLAGKILRDKSVPGFKSATLSHIGDVLQKVERHYGSRDALRLSSKKVSSLQTVMAEIQRLGDLRNITTESLGDVYEQVLITKDIRKIHGTHKTPGYLVDYVVWQLAKWIEEIPVDQLRFFEPGCGHAPFLVSLMRLLRTLVVAPDNLSQFVRERFTGVDNDPFALEIARLSLTLADEPNPDGWDGLTEADMYADGFLEQAAATSTVMLTNPPYESRKAEELLYRTLPNLPAGAVFGAVVPARLLFADKDRAVTLRKWMIENCQLAEIDLFPDGLFTFGDHECAVTIGRVLTKGCSARPLQSRLRRVRDNDAARKAFQLDYRFCSTRLIAQSNFDNEGAELWIAEFQNDIWDYLARSDRLSDLAEVGTGFQHVGQSKLGGATVVSDEEFPGSEFGFATATGAWCLHQGASGKHLSTQAEHIGVARRGLDRKPQVLFNYAPVGRGPWRLKPFIDSVGRPFLSNFVSVTPTGKRGSLEFLWAILTSPVASLFAYVHLLKRHHFPGVIGRIPVPSATAVQVDQVVSLAKRYVSRAKAGKRDMFNSDGFTDQELSRLLLALDAELLRLYALPARSERLLLEQFRGGQRPGIPVPFTEYYPVETPDVPLHAYLANSYQRSLVGKSPELSESDLARYESLLAKAEVGKLTEREANRLHQLQAEVDGRDYAIICASERNAPVVESTAPDEFEQRLRVLSDRAVSASLKWSQQ